jgi:hypothetical protein
MVDDFSAAAKIASIVSKVNVVGSATRGNLAVGKGTVSTPQQYSLRVLKHDAFDVPGGHGAEIEVERTPLGFADPDRKFYAAVLRLRRPSRFVAVLYGDTPNTFAEGAAQVAGLARRFRLQ